MLALGRILVVSAWVSDRLLLSGASAHCRLARKRPRSVEREDWDVDHVLEVGGLAIDARLPKRRSRLSGSTDLIGGRVGHRRFMAAPDAACATGKQAGRRLGKERFPHSSGAHRASHRHGLFPVPCSSNRRSLDGVERQDYSWLGSVSRWSSVCGGAAIRKPPPGVKVQGFVLPHRSRLTEDEYLAGGGPRGWLDQQGFYVYRRNRLIVAGDWLKLRGLSQGRETRPSAYRGRIFPLSRTWTGHWT